MDSRAKLDEGENTSVNILKLISNNSSDIVALLTRDGYPIWTSDSVERILGYKPDEIYNMRVSGESLLHPEDIIAIRSSFEKLLESPAHQIVTYRVKHKLGHWIWIEQTRDPVLDKDGRVEFILTISRCLESPRSDPITLKEFESRFKMVFDQVPTACVCYDREGRIVIFNAEAEKMYGFDEEEVIGRYVWETIAPATEKEASLRVISEVFFGSSYRGVEWSDRRKDGSVCAVVSNLFPVFGPDGSVQMCLSSNTDVSELKETEAALILSEEKYRILIENLQDGAFLIQDSKLIFVNAAFARTVGSPVHEIIGQDFMRYCHPDDVDFIKTRHDARMKGEQVPSEYEFRAIKQDGETVVHVNMNVGVIPYGDGFAAIGTIKDITEKKIAEKELRASEERFRRLSEASQEGIIVHEAGKILDVNKRFADMLGVEPASLIGAMAYDLAAPESRVLMMKNMVSSYDEPFEANVLSNSGEEITVEVRAKLFPYKDKIVRIASLRDVSSYRKVINDLEKSEAKFRLVADNLGEGLLITDIETYEIVYVNEKLCRLTGYDSNHLIGKRVYEMLLFEGDWQRLTARHIERKQGISESYEIQYKRVDGRGVWTQVTASPFRDAEGNVIATLSVVKDIDERRKSESALKESEEKFRNLSDEISDGVAIIIDYELNWVNKAFCQIFNYNRDELLHMKLDTLIAAEDVTKAIAATQAAILSSTSHQTFEFRGIRKGGAEIVIDFAARKLLVENQIAVLIVVRDISERIRSIETLRKSEEQYRLLVESTNAVRFVLNLDSNEFVYISPQVEMVLGYSLSLWTTVDFWESIVHPADKEAFEKFRAMCESSAEQKELEYRMFRADGSVIWVKDIISPVVDDAEIRLSHGLMLDINVQKKAEHLQTVLLNISEMSSAVTTIEKLIAMIHKSLALVMDVSNFYIALYNKKTESYEIPYFTDQYDDLSIFTSSDLKKGMTELVRKSGKPTFIDIKKLAKLKKAGDVSLIGSPPLLWLGVPIKVESETIGVMAVQTYTDESLYNEEDLDLLVIVAGHVGQALMKIFALNELSRSERKFRTLADNVPGAIYLCKNDEKYSMIYLNNKIEELTGFSKEKFTDNQVAFADLIHPDDLELVRTTIDEGLDNNQVYYITYRLKHTSGDYKWVEEFGIGVFEDLELVYLEGFIVDITSRKEAEDALIESREWLSTTLRSIGDSVIATDNEARVIFMNPVAEQLTGYTIEEVVGKPIFDVFVIINEVTGEPAENPVKRIISEGVVVGLANSTALISKDGTSIPIDDSGAPILDREGNVIGTVLVFHDVTEKRRAREALRQSEERFRTMTDAVDAYLWSAEIYGSIERGEYEYKLYTAGIERMSGISAGEFLAKNKTWLSLVHQDDIAVVSEALSRLYKGERTSEAYRIVRPDGDVRWVKDSCTPTLDSAGNLVRLDGVCIDITEMMAVTDELKESEERYRQLVEHSKLGVYVIQNGKYVYVNPAMSGIFGYTTEELLDSLNPIDLTMPEDVDLVQENIRKRIDGDISTLFYEIKGKHKNGRSLDIEVWSGTIEYKGKPAILGTLRDITEIKLAEENLRSVQRMEAMASLSADFAHYFNNTMTVITGNCELALSDCVDGSTREQLVDISNAAKNASGVLSDLIAFSRMQELKTEVIDVPVLIQDTLRFLKQILPENIEIINVFSTDVDHIIADPDRFRQCIINIILNSKEAMPKGGKIQIKVNNKHFDAGCRIGDSEVSPGDYVIVESTDSGCGIPKENIDRIQEPFYTTKDKKRYAGLGLAMVYGFVKQIGGYVSVDSALDIGTTVRLVIPAEKAVSGFQESEFNLCVDCKGNETILLVEDDIFIRNLVGRSLRKYGYAVFTAENGVEALDILKREGSKIDVIVTDVVMPEIGGIKFAEMAKQLYPDIAVIFISGYSAESLSRDEGGVDSNRLLLKPFTPNDLCRAIRRVLTGESE